jgi:hypothetical protein
MESEHAQDLEKTLLLVSQLKFTVQFYTASSRLAALVGTPYIIVESPDQIWGQGQEGIRLNLCTKGEKKLVIAHFKSLHEDHPGALKLVEKAVREMEVGNYKDIIGDVEDIQAIEFMKQQSIDRIGG